MPNMKRRSLFGVAIVLGLLAGAAFFVLRPLMDSRKIARHVEDILQSPQTYDGEIIDNLARLGPDAVPAIGKVLSTDHEFPMTLVYALRELRDPRGAAPLLSFIRSRAPYSDGSQITAEAIRVLGTMPNPIVCEPLTEIFEDDSTHPRVRLTSAATVFRSCEGEAAAEAEDLLLIFWSNRSEYGRVANEGFHVVEALTALVAAAESGEVASILIDIMNVNPWDAFVPSIIESIDGQREGYADALLVVLNAPAPDVPFETRIIAAQRLLDLGERPDGLQERIEELMTYAETNGYPPAILEQVWQLRRNSESRLLD